LLSFYSLLNDFFATDFSEIYKELLILGYYLNKHNYLIINNYFFSESNVRNKLLQPYSKEDFDDYALIFRIVHQNYDTYQNAIYNSVGKNIEFIFKFKSNDDNIATTFNKLAEESSKDLSVSEINMINDSFNCYQYHLRRFLEGVQGW
jgi:hypothetical protein